MTLKSNSKIKDYQFDTPKNDKIDSRLNILFEAKLEHPVNPIKDLQMPLDMDDFERQL